MINLEFLADSYPNSRGSYSQHQLMIEDLVTYLFEYTNPLAIYTNIELMEKNWWGKEYAIGEIDVFVIREDVNEIYNVKSRCKKSHHHKTQVQFRREVAYVLKNWVGTNIDYYSFMPGYFKKLIGGVKAE